MNNFISSASDRKKEKIKQLYNTAQRNEKHRQIEQASNVTKSIRTTEIA